MSTLHRFAPTLSIALVSVLLALLALVAQGCGTRWDHGPLGMTWELRGKHLEVSCEGCHVPEAQLGDLPTACEGCHEPDRPVPHDQGPCGECHTELGWGDIAHTFLPLEDAHALDCQVCHVGEDYAGLSAECWSCHEPDRPQDHFGDTDCGTCHPATRWSDGEFDHAPFFPLPHRGVAACTECHLTGSYAAFSCTHCHEHRQSEADDEHQEVSGYQYDSAACLDCHPDGRE